MRFDSRCTDLILQYCRHLLLKLLNDSHRLLVMLESNRAKLIKRTLTRMTKRRMAKVMTQCDGLRQIFVQTQCSSDRARHLGHFKRMRKTSPVVIAFR